MATRGNVIFLEEEYFNLRELDDNLSIYIHYDMYEEHFIPILKKFLNLNGAIARRFDSSYIMAWFIKFYIDEIKDVENIEELNDFTGIGVDKGINDWSEYVYVITPTRNTDGEGNFKIDVWHMNKPYITNELSI